MMLCTCATFCGWEKHVFPNRLGDEGAKKDTATIVS